MNQILGNMHNLKNNINSTKPNYFKIVFWFFFILSIISIIILFIINHNKKQNELFSQELVKNYKITTLYNLDSNKNSNYISSKLSSEKLIEDNSFVIGLISIDKINLTYPILSSTNDELLKIAPCKFYRSIAK